MEIRNKINKINIPPLSYKLCKQLLAENPVLGGIISNSNSPEEANRRLMTMIREWLAEGHEYALAFAERRLTPPVEPDKLKWDEIAAVRIFDYLTNAGREYENLNKRIKVSVNDPFVLVWLAWHNRKGGGRPEFFYDMNHLFRQFSGREKRTIPDKSKITEWMQRYPAGTEAAMVRNRAVNRERIISLLADIIDKGEQSTP